MLKVASSCCLLMFIKVEIRKNGVLEVFVLIAPQGSSYLYIQGSNYHDM